MKELNYLIAIVFLLFLTVIFIGFYKANEPEHITGYYAVTVCDDWRPFLGGDMSWAMYDKAGCPLPADEDQGMLYPPDYVCRIWKESEPTDYSEQQFYNRHCKTETSCNVDDIGECY